MTQHQIGNFIKLALVSLVGGSVSEGAVMGPKVVRTRQKSGDLGAPSALPEAGSLPTNKDVIAAVTHEIETSREQSKNDKQKVAIIEVKDSVVKKFHEVNPALPLIQEGSVVKKMTRLFETSKKAKRKQLKPKELNLFSEKLNHLFDIIACTCEIINCGGGQACRSKEDCTGFHVLCSCPPQMQIPEKEVQYVKDQRDKIGLHGGAMFMTGKDYAETKLQKEQAEKEKKLARKAEKRAADAAKVDANIKKKRDNIFAAHAEDDFLLEEETLETEEYEESFPWTTGQQDNRDSKKTTIKIDLYAAELTRYGVSDRAGAALWNACIKCLEENNVIQNEGETTITENLTVDRYKIRRSKDSFARKQKAKKREETKDGIECFGTDGKRNKKTRMTKTITVNGVEEEKHFVGTEEHIVYTHEPKGEYLDHTTPKYGTGRGLATDFVDVLADNNSTESLCAICCDGTNVNTGWREGMFAHVERDLQRKLLLCSCMLHANELPFRKLFDSCDGNFGTTGPESFGGELGKQATKDLHSEDVVDFEAVETNLEEINDDVVKTLSRDQNLMYRYILAVSKGKVSSNLATQKVGPLNHSRWLTLAIRLLQLYTRTEVPSDGLRKIVRFITQVYGPSWFAIKKAGTFTKGPALLFQQMVLIKTQPEDVQRLVKPVVQRNAYMAEPGIMLCSMLESTSLSIRQKAMKTIEKLRAKHSKKPRMKILKGIRPLKVPVLQWDAFSWVDMIDWKTASVHQPYIIERLSDDEVASTLWKPQAFPPFPLHTQTVERAVKLVTEASSQVCGQERRHGYILSVLEARKIRKPFDTKCDYNVSLALAHTPAYGFVGSLNRK